MVTTNVPKKPCVVIGKVFPSWLLQVPELGHQAEQLLVQFPSHVVCIHKICSADVPIWSQANLPELVAALSPQGEGAVCFIDGCVTLGLLAALTNVGIQEVVFMQTP
jgi:hypothetical protein